MVSRAVETPVRASISTPVLPVVRTVNAWGGALLGLVWAVLLLFAAVWLMQRFNWVVTPELIRDSILLKFFAENNPIGLIAAL